MFLIAGWGKFRYGFTPPEWFVGLDFPWPQSQLPVQLNWIAAIGGELLLPWLLFTRFRILGVLGLIYICFVAVYTSHFDLGWAGWNDPEDGFKIPLMYAIGLLAVARE